jgi:hypothetical protein
MVNALRTILRMSVGAVAMAATIVAASAGSIDVQTLQSMCKADKNSAQWGYCVGYIVGVAEKMKDFGLQRQAFGDGTTPRPRESLCPDGDINFDATVMVPLFINWVEHHPEQLGYPASFPVGEALQGKWPCKFSN